LRASLGWYGTYFYDSEMALISEWMEQCGKKVLDNAGIVREAIFYAAIMVDAVFVTGGIIGIAAMTRSLIRSNRDGDDQALVPPPYPLVPGSAPPQPAPSPVILPNVTSPRAPRSRPIAALAAHLSPASAAAIQQLVVAITAKIAAEVALGVVGWNGALGSPRAPFPLYHFGFMAWGLAAIAPHLVLLYFVARRPGRSAYAYALVIPRRRQ
ncbi:MAG: hypothetical protein WB762_18775, partial [Candidatus Sulfotelmatobacter sp.]